MSTLLTAQSISQLLKKMRLTTPLVLNVTNWVAMNPSANVLLATGSSPIMAHALDELGELIFLAQALVLNIGTLDERWIASLEHAQRFALQGKLPIVLDPVGAGASTLRTKTAQALLAKGVSVVHGNASEIMALASERQSTKGVDSTEGSYVALEMAQQLSKQYNCCVVVSGKDDLVCYRDNVICCQQGDEMLTHITGMGCSVSALIGAFLAIEPDLVLASASAMLSFGIAAEQAGKSSRGPGSFYSELLDALYRLHEHELIEPNWQVVESCLI